jgi:hypothetical protein
MRALTGGSEGANPALASHPLWGDGSASADQVGIVESLHRLQLEINDVYSRDTRVQGNRLNVGGAELGEFETGLGQRKFRAVGA